jgi:hypothetical protein
MTLTTSQKLNEIKRSFFKYLADNLPAIQIDFDDADFSPPDDSPFLAIRFLRSSREPCGIGGIVTGDSPNLRGCRHKIQANLSIYKRHDPQKADVGGLYSTVAALLNAGDIPLYNFTDPEHPVESGKIFLDPLPAATGPSPIEGRLADNLMNRELADAGFAWAGIGVLLSVLEQY